MIVHERRAAAVLHNLFRTLRDPRPWLLPANSCHTLPLTFRRAGQPFECIDLGEDLGIDPERCLERLESAPGAYAGVLYVRPYGAELPAAGDLFRAVKQLDPALLVIDDRCLAPPDPAGAHLEPEADVTLYSTGRAKPVDLGWGGFAHLTAGLAELYRRTTGARAPFREEALAEVERRAKEALATGRPFAAVEDETAWLDLDAPPLAWEAYRREVEAALPAAAAHRAALNEVYESAMPEEVRLPAVYQGWRFQMLVPEPDRLVAALFAASLFASRHYPSLGGVFCEGSFPAAERLHGRVVNLFNDRNFDVGRAEKAAALVRRHLGL